MDSRDIAIGVLLAIAAALAWLWHRAAWQVALMRQKPPCIISEVDCKDGHYAEPVIWPGESGITVGDRRTGRPLGFVGHTSTQWHTIMKPNGTAGVMCILEGIPVENRNGSHAQRIV